MPPMIPYTDVPEEEMASQVPMGPFGQPLAPPPSGPVAPPPQAQAQAQGATTPEQTKKHHGWLGQALMAVAPTLLAGGGALLANKNGNKPGATHDIGQILGGIAGGFAQERHKFGTEKRAAAYKQNEAMLETAHKAVMAIQGKDLKDFPNLAKLRSKYVEAMASEESDGNFISPKEAQELISLWVVSEGELTKLDEKETGRKAEVDGRAKVQGELATERAYNPQMSPEAAQGAVSQRRQEGLDMQRPVSLGSLGIPGMPAGASSLKVSGEVGAKMVMEDMRQANIATRQNQQQAAQFAQQMAAEAARFKQAEAANDSRAMIASHDRAMIAALNPDVNGERLFPDEASAEAFVARHLRKMRGLLTAPPAGAQKGMVDPNSIREVTGHGPFLGGFR